MAAAAYTSLPSDERNGSVTNAGAADGEQQVLLAKEGLWRIAIDTACDGLIEVQTAKGSASLLSCVSNRTSRACRPRCASKSMASPDT